MLVLCASAAAENDCRRSPIPGAGGYDGPQYECRQPAGDELHRPDRAVVALEHLKELLDRKRQLTRLPRALDEGRKTNRHDQRTGHPLGDARPSLDAWQIRTERHPETAPTQDGTKRDGSDRQRDAKGQGYEDEANHDGTALGPGKPEHRDGERT